MINPATTSQSPVRAIGYMLAGGALLTLSDAVVKSLTPFYPTGQILFYRALFIFLPILVFTWRSGGANVLRVKNVKGQAARAFCVIGGSFCFVTGLQYLPLADMIAIGFAAPLVVTSMAPVFLGEQVGWRRWLAVGAGFAGVLVMVRPTGDAFQWAIIFPIAAVLFGSTRDVVTRHILRSESTLAVLFVTTTMVLLAGLATWPLGWSTLDPWHLWRFLVVGILVGGGHYLVIEAFRYGEASVVVPFKYTNLIWATLFGYLLFGHLPRAGTITGAAIVVVTGIYILHRETLRKRAQRQ